MPIKVDKKRLLGDWGKSPDVDLCRSLGIDPFDSPRISKDLEIENPKKDGGKKNEQF